MREENNDDIRVVRNVLRYLKLLPYWAVRKSNFKVLVRGFQNRSGSVMCGL